MHPSVQCHFMLHLFWQPPVFMPHPWQRIGLWHSWTTFVSFKNKLKSWNHSMSMSPNIHAWKPSSFSPPVSTEHFFLSVGSLFSYSLYFSLFLSPFLSLSLSLFGSSNPYWFRYKKVAMKSSERKKGEGEKRVRRSGESKILVHVSCISKAWGRFRPQTHERDTWNHSQEKNEEVRKWERDRSKKRGKRVTEEREERPK